MKDPSTIRRTYETLLSRYVGDVVIARAHLIEQAIEAALQGGENGVAVIDKENAVTVARVDPHVPYGHIFEFPSQDAYDKWVENGRPQ